MLWWGISSDPGGMACGYMCVRLFMISLEEFGCVVYLEDCGSHGHGGDVSFEFLRMLSGIGAMLM